MVAPARTAISSATNDVVLLRLDRRSDIVPAAHPAVAAATAAARADAAVDWATIIAMLDRAEWFLLTALPAPPLSSHHSDNTAVDAAAPSAIVVRHEAAAPPTTTTTTTTVTTAATAMARKRKFGKGPSWWDMLKTDPDKAAKRAIAKMRSRQQKQPQQQRQHQQQQHGKRGDDNDDDDEALQKLCRGAAKLRMSCREATPAESEKMVALLQEKQPELFMKLAKGELG
jgi:hypothetical protein